MKPSSARPRRWATALATGSLIATVLLAAPSARAEPVRPAAPQSHDVPVAAGISGKDAKALVADLGASRTGGVYLDRESGRLVIAVTDEAAAKEVTAAGGIADRVTHSTTDLNAVTEALNKSTTTPGTSWGTDPATNQIVVNADSTVSDAEFAKLKKTAEPFGSAVRVARVGGELTPNIAGGNYIATDDLSCSLGFNVRKKADPNSLYFLTAGHCTVGSSGVADWRDGNGTYIGYDAGGFFPENDFGLVRHYNANVSKPGNVYLHNGSYQDITHSRDPYDGESICRSGYKTGYNCGTVQQLNVTANYSSGPVYGLFTTNICSSGGDSGGPLFHGDAALGLHSGSNGNCTGYHQPVNEALAWYEVEVY